MSNKSWKEVTRNNPCSHCEGKSWCSRSTDGNFEICRRLNDGNGLTKTDKSGTDFYLHYIGQKNFLSQQRQARKSYRKPPKIEENINTVGTDEERHAVYSSILELIDLSEPHRAGLRKRGLSDEEIVRRKYRSMSLRGRAKIVTELLKTFEPALLGKIPGFYFNDKRVLKFLSAPGTIIPVRNAQGLVTALKVRRDESTVGPGAIESVVPKYLWVSSKKKGGPSPGNPVHVPLMEENSNNRFRITEGELKGDIATALSRTPTLSVGGITSWRSILKTLKEMKARTVVLAADMDAFVNRHVAEALQKMALAFKKEGYAVEIETWDSAQAKGIDDALLHGVEISLHTGAQTMRTINEIVASAVTKNPTVEETKLYNAKKLVIEARNLLKNDPGFAFQSDVLRALLMVRTKDKAEWALFRSTAQKCKVLLSDLESALEREDQLQHQETFEPKENAEWIEPTATELSAPSSHGCKPSGLPEVIVNGRQPRDVIDDFWHAVHMRNKNGLEIFRKGNFLVRPSFDEDGHGSLTEITDVTLKDILFRSSDLLRFDKSSGGLVPATLPEYVASNMTATPNTDLLSLNSIVGVPYFNKSGKLVVDPGHHPEDETLLKYPNDLVRIENISPISANESRKMIDWLMDELFSDFPFASALDRTHILIAIFQPFIRKMIFGPTPLLLISAPTEGSGKTKLAQIISAIAVGAEIDVCTLAADEGERKKMFFSELLSGRQIVLLDNLDDGTGRENYRYETGEFHSPSLAAILTSTVYKDRILGISKMVQVPNTALWIMTANNPSLHREIWRRVVSIHLEPDTEKPWDRSESSFKHPDILQWVKANRRQLLVVVLTVIRSWIEAGRPPMPGKSLGSFESWSDTMRSLFGFLGFTDFLTNQAEKGLAYDPLYEIWVEFVRRWWAFFQSSPVSVSEILKVNHDGFLAPIIGGALSTPAQYSALGKRLGKLGGKIYDGMKLNVVPSKDAKKDGRLYFLSRPKEATRERSGEVPEVLRKPQTNADENSNWTGNGIQNP